VVSSGGIDRLATVALGGLASAAVAVALFVVYPETLTDLFGVLVALAAVLVGLRFASNIAGSLFPAYDVAEVSVEGRSAGTAVAARSPRVRARHRQTTSSTRSTARTTTTTFGRCS